MTTKPDDIVNNTAARIRLFTIMDRLLQQQESILRWNIALTIAFIATIILNILILIK